jgi:hypothetical protein
VIVRVSELLAVFFSQGTAAIFATTGYVPAAGGDLSVTVAVPDACAVVLGTIV